MTSQSAKIISILGHPLLIGLVYVIFVSFQKLPQESAALISGLMIGIVALPIVLHNWFRSKNGTYTNFDVSDQNQRKGFYPIAMSLFLLILIFFYFLDLPNEVILSTFLFLLLLVVMALLNLKIKASLHAAISFYIAVHLFEFGPVFGFSMLVFSILISGSRWQMKRHSFSEIILGGVVGCVFGVIGVWIMP